MITGKELRKTLTPTAKSKSTPKSTTASAAKSESSPKPPDQVDHLNTILALTLQNMNSKVVDQLIQKACQTSGELTTELKGIFIISEDEVQEWKDGDDYELYDDDGKRKKVVLNNAEPIKDGNQST